MSLKKLVLIVLFAVCSIIFVNSAYIIKETQQAIVLAFGKVQEVNAKPGLNFKAPFYEQVVLIDKRILEADSRPEELQTLNKELIIVDSFTKWRVIDARKFYEKLGTTTRARSRINTVINSNVREAIAQITLKDLISGNREKVLSSVMDNSKAKAAEYGLEIIDIRIKRVDLPQANANYVYNDMKAERNKEAKELRAKGSEDSQKIKARAEKEAKVIIANAKESAEKLKGNGDAQSIKIYAKAYSKDPRFYELSRTLESYKKSLNSKETTLVLDPSVKYLDALQSGR